MSGQTCTLLPKEKEAQDGASPGRIEDDEEIYRLITSPNQLDTTGEPAPSFFDPVSKGSSVIRLRWVESWHNAVQTVCGSTADRPEKDYQGYVQFYAYEVRQVKTDHETEYVDGQDLRVGVRALQILDYTRGISFHAKIHYADVDPSFKKRHKRDIRAKLYLAMKDRFYRDSLAIT